MTKKSNKHQKVEDLIPVQDVINPQEYLKNEVNSSKQDVELKPPSMSVQDVIEHQEYLKRVANFDKPDDELTPSEQMIKSLSQTLYQNLDENIENAIGKDAKKDIDETRNLMDKLTQARSNLRKMTELGREIEKNMFLQSIYLLHHFKKDENNQYFLLTRKLDEVILNDSTPVNERISGAQSILEIVKVYEEKIITELEVKQDILNALLGVFEKYLKEIDFAILGKDLEIIEQKYSRWLTLTKDLVKSRKKAINAVQEDLELDKIIPKFVIDNDGDLTQTMSEFEMKSRGDRCIRFIKEAEELEKKIEEERSQISSYLFGVQDEYMDFDEKKENSNKQKGVTYNPLEKEIWFRFLKVLYIGLWVVGLGFVALLSYVYKSGGAFITGSLIVWGVMEIIKKSFFYIVLGEK